MVDFDAVLCVLLGVVERERQKFDDGSSHGWRPVGGDFTRRVVDTYGTYEEPGGSQRVALGGEESADELAGHCCIERNPLEPILDSCAGPGWTRLPG